MQSAENTAMVSAGNRLESALEMVKYLKYRIFFEVPAAGT